MNDQVLMNETLQALFERKKLLNNKWRELHKTITDNHFQTCPEDHDQNPACNVLQTGSEWEDLELITRELLAVLKLQKEELLKQFNLSEQYEATSARYHKIVDTYTKQEDLLKGYLSE